MPTVRKSTLRMSYLSLLAEKQLLISDLFYTPAADKLRGSQSASSYLKSTCWTTEPIPEKNVTFTKFLCYIETPIAAGYIPYQFIIVSTK